MSPLTSSRLSRLAAGLALAAALALPLAGPVAAATPAAGPDSATAAAPADPCASQRSAFLADPTLAHAKGLGDCMASIRLTFLARASTRVEQSKVLTTGDRESLLAILSPDVDGIQALKAKLDAETTVKGAVADFRAMVLDYRVFVLGGRQVALVTGADAVGAVAGRFDAVHQKLEALIDAAEGRGRDVTAARASLAAMDASVAQARSDVEGLSPKLLALTPAEWNAGTAKPVLDSARASIHAGRDALVAARKDAAAVLKDLGL